MHGNVPHLIYEGGIKNGTIKREIRAIIDFELKEIGKIWNEDQIKNLERKYKIKLPQDYSFYLQHYGNDYIKEDYHFIPSEGLPNKIKLTQFEIDSIYGLYNDENKIDDKINFYKNILPADLFPIADLPGGDLVCIGKKMTHKIKYIFGFTKWMEKMFIWHLTLLKIL